MKRFLGFVKKEFHHILRDKRTLLILFGLPIVLVIIFGYALDNDLKNIPIAVLDQSKDDASIRLTNKLISSGYFKLNNNLNSEKEIGETFKKGTVKMVIVLPSGFSDKIYHGKSADIQLIADATDVNTATSITSYASSIVKDFNREIGQPGNQLEIVISSRMIFNQELVSVYLFIPGVIALILLIISAMLTSVTLAREKETGTMELLSISPIKPMLIVVGKVIPYLIFSIINCFIIILMGIFIFGLPLNGSIVLLIAECILYIITALSLGILISTKAETQQTAMFISLVALMMPSMLLSGFIFPIESLPLVLQYISKIIPTTHFIEIIKTIMIKGGGLEVIWMQTLILILMTTVFLGISIKSIAKQNN